jgi:hypothetical protein
MYRALAFNGSDNKRIPEAYRSLLDCSHLLFPILAAVLLFFRRQRTADGRGKKSLSDYRRTCPVTSCLELIPQKHRPGNHPASSAVLLLSTIPQHCEGIPAQREEKNLPFVENAKGGALHFLGYFIIMKAFCGKRSQDLEEEVPRGRLGFSMMISAAGTLPYQYDKCWRVWDQVRFFISDSSALKRTTRDLRKIA